MMRNKIYLDKDKYIYVRNDISEKFTDEFDSLITMSKLFNTYIGYIEQKRSFFVDFSFIKNSVFNLQFRIFNEINRGLMNVALQCIEKEDLHEISEYIKNHFNEKDFFFYERSIISKNNEASIQLIKTCNYFLHK